MLILLIRQKRSTTTVILKENIIIYFNFVQLEIKLTILKLLFILTKVTSYLFEVMINYAKKAIYLEQYFSFLRDSKCRR